MIARPPALALLLLSWLLSPEWLDFVVRDREEEFGDRARRSVPAARRWFWRQTLRCVARPPRHHQPLPIRTGDPFVLTLLSDVRHALRVFVRAPSYAVAVVGVLALAIGANTAIFSIVNAVLLRPLPFEEPERLVRIFTRTARGAPF